MAVAFILGTRPEIIKLCPVIKECARRKIPHYIIHTGQHYSHNLDKVFFAELRLPQPRFNLHTGSISAGEQIGIMTRNLSSLLNKCQPKLVIVEGDTNSVLAGALAALSCKIKIAHVEAGLRSFDRSMQEERNRIIVDHIADHLFAPTQSAARFLMREGIERGRVIVTGNTIVDAIRANARLAAQRPVLKQLEVTPGEYFVATAHRQEMVNSRKKLAGLLKGLAALYARYGEPIIFPLHPRTKKMLSRFRLTLPTGVRAIEPLGYLDFLALLSNARLVITDSGGIQEEACILRVPCITTRDSTERPETLTVRCNMLVGNKPRKISAGAKIMLSRKRNWKNPYGDGQAAIRICDRIARDL